MSDDREFLPEPGDDALLEMLSRLQRLEPPLETRIANRMAVAAELASLGVLNRKRHVPWWRRCVSVPVPIAASLAVLAALVLASSFRSWQEQAAVQVAAPHQPARGAADVPRQKTAIAKRTPDTRTESKYYATETYLCGIGRVNSESHYLVKE
jgi:hypothetical protein